MAHRLLFILSFCAPWGQLLSDNNYSPLDPKCLNITKQTAVRTFNFTFNMLIVSDMLIQL